MSLVVESLSFLGARCLDARPLRAAAYYSACAWSRCVLGQVVLSFMYLTYAVVGAVFLVAVFAAMIWLFLAALRRGTASPNVLGREFVWTLVPALVVVGLTVLGEVPRGWVTFATGARAAEIQSRVIH